VSKNFKDCQLKGTILRAINSGSNTSKTIYAAVKYPHHIDSLYRELNFLRSYGYISKHKGAESTYTLTKKGLEHSRNPYLFVEFKKNRIKNTVQNLVTATLEDNDKFKVAVQKYANEHFSNPIILPPQRPEIDPEGLNRGDHANIPITLISNPEDVPVVDSINPHKPHDNTTLISDDFLKTLLEDSKKLQELEKQLNNRPGGNESVLIERIKKLEDENRDMAIQLQYAVKPTEYLDKVSGAVLTPEAVRAFRSKAQQRNNQSKMNADRRRKLVNSYRGYTLDATFFGEWGSIYPYWIKHFGLFKAGSIEILSPSNDEIRLRDHSKGI